MQVERRTGKVRSPKTDVLPLCYATNQCTGISCSGLYVQYAIMAVPVRTDLRLLDIVPSVMHWQHDDEQNNLS